MFLFITQFFWFSFFSKFLKFWILTDRFSMNRFLRFSPSLLMVANGEQWSRCQRKHRACFVIINTKYGVWWNRISSSNFECVVSWKHVLRGCGIKTKKKSTWQKQRPKNQNLALRSCAHSNNYWKWYF